MAQRAIPYMQLRGGSSKGLYFKAADLPADGGLELPDGERVSKKAGDPPRLLVRVESAVGEEPAYGLPVGGLQPVPGGFYTGFQASSASSSPSWFFSRAATAYSFAA